MKVAWFFLRVWIGVILAIVGVVLIGAGLIGLGYTLRGAYGQAGVAAEVFLLVTMLIALMITAAQYGD